MYRLTEPWGTIVWQVWCHLIQLLHWEFHGIEICRQKTESAKLSMDSSDLTDLSSYKTSQYHPYWKDITNPQPTYSSPNLPTPP